MKATIPDAAWEAMFVPYDQDTYQAVLDQLSPDDVVLDIGAGDLRLDYQMARLVQKVYAVEINAEVLEQARGPRAWLPGNLIAICGDARELDFPSEVTTGVLLMRHCTCFGLYMEKLQKAGAARLVTNARWRMDVEVVDLQVRRQPFVNTDMGWYACLCGRTGFKEGPAEHWTHEMNRIVHEVSSCPHCVNFGDD